MGKKEDSPYRCELPSNSVLHLLGNWEWQSWYLWTSCGLTSGFVLDVIIAAKSRRPLYTLLNGTTYFVGKFAGIGFVYGGLEKGIFELRRNVHGGDVLNCSLAGMGTGALYKCRSGPKVAAVAAGIGGLTAAGLQVLGKSM